MMDTTFVHCTLFNIIMRTINDNDVFFVLGQFFSFILLYIEIVRSFYQSKKCRYLLEVNDEIFMEALHGHI